MATRKRTWLMLAPLTAAACATVWAAPPAKTKATDRAKPPVWTDADVAPFFPDAREALVGERPVVANAAGSGDAATADTEKAGGKFEWSRVIEADALAAEVKRLAARLAAPLANPATFKAGGNKTCRAEFAYLAVVFAVIDQYNGDVRWKGDAAALREALTRASANCKSASDQTYAESTRVREQLDDLIRGSRLGGKVPPEVEHWSTIADRPLLMQRMQRAMQEGVNPKMGDARTFAKAAADVRQEAQVLAMLADVISREEYENWDDQTFAGYARELGEAAGELSRAAADGNYEAARAAAGRARQACVTCHDGYRL